MKRLSFLLLFAGLLISTCGTAAKIDTALIIVRNPALLDMKKFIEVTHQAEIKYGNAVEALSDTVWLFTQIATTYEKRYLARAGSIDCPVPNKYDYCKDGCIDVYPCIIIYTTDIPVEKELFVQNIYTGEFVSLTTLYNGLIFF